MLKERKRERERVDDTGMKKEPPQVGKPHWSVGASKQHAPCDIGALHVRESHARYSDRRQHPSLCVYQREVATVLCCARSSCVATTFGNTPDPGSNMMNPNLVLFIIHRRLPQEEM